MPIPDLMRRLRLIYLLLFCTFIFLPRTSFAQDYICISTDPVNGQITFTWSFPNVASTAAYYTFQWSLTSGIWDQNVYEQFSNPPLVTAYTIPGINGNNKRYYFRLYEVNANGSGFETWPSNIFLTATGIDKRVAKLDWNPGWLGSVGIHHLQRLENGVWNTIYSIPNDLTYVTQTYTYNDTLTNPPCDTTRISYRVFFEQRFGSCSSVSNINSADVLGRFIPQDPPIDTVSIFQDPTGTYTGCPVISWSKSPSKDITGYIIYRKDPVFIAIDTIPSGSTQFIDKAVKGCSGSFTYALAAINDCGKTSPGTFIITPHNIVIDALSIDPCERKAFLNWNAYDYMPGGLGGYIVYRQVNSGSFTAVDTLAPGITSFYDSIRFINGNEYTYFIRAFSQTGTRSSSSCVKKVTYKGPVIPDTIYITQVSIVNNSVVEASYYYSPDNRIREMVLERSDSPGGPFSPVDTLGSQTGNFLLQQAHLTDPTANVSHQSYFYRLTMIDSCNNATLYSENISRTIFLSCSSPTTQSSLIEWNTYSEWYNGVEQYEIYRTFDGIPDPSAPLGQVTGSSFSYLDDQVSVPTSVHVCYYIRAVEFPGNPVAGNAFSLSNIACAFRETLFFMPNAFNPRGTNNKFRPVQSYIASDGFMMQIYNKWGQMIFETTDIIAGWDGNIKGSLAPVGLYVYNIRYKSLQGEEYGKRGTVMLVE